ncbi:hypothetical protein L484_005725 [Morus notabilis]|uniref:DUF7953 domain-containing protein n=1 Tax=Morus notabilis TaxID=981085 RepID=W9QWM0_9ROSA|nr:uncharacterized protein LOC21389180 [Morus notabilis]EXB23435.1 hypothetical protein L484_005725 [Morus notabilis]
MAILDLMEVRISAIFLLGSSFLSCFSGLVLSAIVRLDSIEIYKTHEILKSVKPKVYFSCKGENKTDLPDVKKSHELYKFKGEESWQPLTELPDKKCKRCGFYEKDVFKSDDVFDEWEFCPSDFTSDGKYIRFKDNEVNATFSCPKCTPSSTGSNSASDSHKGRKGMHVALIILISALISTVLILGLIAAYKYWQKKKREQDQARFLKLFEEGDDIEDELGLGI